MRGVALIALQEGSYDAAVAGCTYVIHPAANVTFVVKDPQRDLVDPALMGTLNVLRSCDKAGTVNTVVVTSSLSAVSSLPFKSKAEVVPSKRFCFSLALIVYVVVVVC